MIRADHPLSPLATLAVLAAATLPAAGCSDPEPARAQVILTSSINPGSNPPSGCPESGTWFDIGSFGNPASPVEAEQKPRAVLDGDTDPSGGQAALTCAVTLAPDGFNVKGTARLTGGNGGAFTIQGLFKAEGEQTGISATFAKVGRSDPYIGSDCTVRYTSPTQGVAAGRVWGEVTCPAATAAGVARTCETVATFRFENCVQ